MNKKEIQRQRMRTYFINGAKEIIKEEGIKGLTVRKVGERAGYSYATIYNYFSDLNTLLAYCMLDFLEDCYHYMLNFKIETEDSKNQLIAYELAYFRYFAENPDMFQIIFIEELGKPPKELMKENTLPSVGLLLRESLIKCAQEGYIAEEKIELLGELITASLHGKLLLFIKGRDGSNLENMISLIEKEMAFLLSQAGG
ncbi:MAG: TetR/AcrR family transcriptional regulator [Thermotaleaceae bacterium]